MSKLQNPGPSGHERMDDEYEAQIAALDAAPTGAPLTARDWAFLVATGLVAPVLLLIWGWA